MTRSLDPLNVPIDWHRFLYRSILLEWETSVHSRKKFDKYRTGVPCCGVTLVKVNSLKDMDPEIGRFQQAKKPIERLVFCGAGPAHKALFGLLRNCVAHGHYALLKRGWIEFSHEYQSKVRLSGQVKIVTLKALISNILASSH